jgi:hypothetical protein
LHGYFEIEAGEDGRMRREKVTGRVLTLDRALGDSTHICSVCPESSKTTTLEQMDS